MNHELGRSFPFTGRPPGRGRAHLAARDRPQEPRRARRGVPVHGNEGFERFCSRDADHGRRRSVLLHGRGSRDDARSAAGSGPRRQLDRHGSRHRDVGRDGALRPLPARERRAAQAPNKWVFLSSEDDFRSRARRLPVRLHRGHFNGGIRGREGSLYVWKANNPAKNENATVAKNESIPGTFVPLTQAENANSDARSRTRRSRRAAFEFDRLEDIAVRPDVSGRTYIADTGKPPTTARGRIYQFDIDPSNPTQGDAEDDPERRRRRPIRRHVQPRQHGRVGGC